MKTYLQGIVRAVVAVLATAAPLAWPAVAAGKCYSDWSVAAPIVRREGLVTVEELSTQLRGRYPGELVKATLCEGGEGYAFRLVIREVNGQLRSLELNAKRPFGP